VSRGIALLFSRNFGIRWGWGVSPTPRPPLSPVKTRYPLHRRLGGPPRPVWTGGKSSPHRDSIPESPARSQSLHRLSYPVHPYEYVNDTIMYVLIASAKVLLQLVFHVSVQSTDQLSADCFLILVCSICLDFSIERHVYISLSSFDSIISLSLITVILINAITIIKKIICAMFVIMSHLFSQSPLRYLTALTTLGKLQMHLTNFLDKDPPLSFHPLGNKCCSHVFTFCKSVRSHTSKIQEDGKRRFRNSMLLTFPFFR